MLSLLISEHTPRLEFVVPFIAAAEQRFHVLITHMVAAEGAMGPADQALDLGGGGAMDLVAAALSLIGRAPFMLVALVLVLVVIWAVCELGNCRRYWALASAIPGPPAELWRGNLRDIQAAGGWVHYTAFIRGLHKEYGPVVRFWRGRQLVVSVHVSLMSEGFFHFCPSQEFPEALCRSVVNYSRRKTGNISSLMHCTPLCPWLPLIERTVRIFV